MKDLVTIDDVEAISIGAGILGTGGGGDPYLESIQLRRELEHYGPQKLIDPKTLETTARMVVVGMIGAPTAGIEKLREGTEILRAVQLLENHLDESESKNLIFLWHLLFYPPLHKPVQEYIKNLKYMDIHYKGFHNV